MGAFKNEKNGTWYVQFRYTDWQGLRQQKLKRGFATKREAQEWERAFLTEKKADVTMPFKTFTELYEKDVRPKLKENTWLTKEHIIKTKILPYFEHKRLCDISAKDVIAWQNEIRKQTNSSGEPFSQGYLKTIHNQLSSLFNHAINKYHEWFEKRMETQTIEIRKAFAAKNNVEIDKVPSYKIKTPLQQAVQLLKRHRDIMYDKLPEARKKNAPISIIITTLAALAYNNESNLYDALNSIVSKMENYIEKDGDTYKILNPVMQEENFADKWNMEPAKANEFFCWLQCVKNEIITEPLNAQGVHILTGNLETCFGKNIVQRSIKDEGEAIKTARENKSLYVSGLKGGLQTSSTNTAKKVGGHTFFGK